MCKESKRQTISVDDVLKGSRYLMRWSLQSLQSPLGLGCKVNLAVFILLAPCQILHGVIDINLQIHKLISQSEIFLLQMDIIFLSNSTTHVLSDILSSGYICLTFFLIVKSVYIFSSYIPDYMVLKTSVLFDAEQHEQSMRLVPYAQLVQLLFFSCHVIFLYLCSRNKIR